MRRITASRSSLALACGYWRREEVPLDERSGPAAKAGQAFHDAVERLIPGDAINVSAVLRSYGLAPAALARTAKCVERWTEWWPVNKPEGRLLPEIALAYDVEADEGRVLPKKHHRDYSAAKPTEVTGSADLIVMTDATLEVWDWKSGAGWVEPPERNEQLATLGLAAARTFGRRELEVSVVRCSEHDVRRFSARLTGLDIDVHADRLAAAHGEKDPQPRPGDHCKWCPAREACPAYQKLPRAAAGA